MLDISYEEFKENVKNIISEEFFKTHIDNRIIYQFAQNKGDNLVIKKYKGNDLKNLSEEEMNFINERIKEHYKMFYGEKYKELKKNVRISRVYDVNVTNENWKSVYSNQIVETKDSKNSIIVVNNRYVFEEIDSTWKIIRIDTEVNSFDDDKKEKYGITKDEFLKNMRFSTKDNKDIEYIRTYSMNLYLLD